ncbi:MAG: hypothetical protein JO147_03880, partial [Actinobacteria bacterium]|nr:hypothetical protein [Actinomycetota bacterium]
MLKLSKQTSIIVVAALIGLFIAGASALLFGGGRSASAAAAPEPWVGTDPNAAGGLAFFDSSGHQITGGNLTDSPIATYVVGTTELRAGDSLATLSAVLPDPAKQPAQFSADQLSGSIVYPVSSAPAPIGSTTLPVSPGQAGDESVAILMDDFPQNATAAGYVNTYEVRLKTSAPGKTATINYDFAEITVDKAAGTWTLAYTPASNFPPPSDT